MLEAWNYAMDRSHQVVMLVGRGLLADPGRLWPFMLAPFRRKLSETVFVLM